MEWSGTASATVGSTWYFGAAQERLDAEPSHLCLDVLYCFALPLKSYLSINIVWKGRLT